MASDRRKLIVQGHASRSLKELTKAYINVPTSQSPYCGEPAKEPSAWKPNPRTLDVSEEQFSVGEGLFTSISSFQPGDPARGAIEYTRTLNEMNEFLREEPSGY